MNSLNINNKLTGEILLSKPNNTIEVTVEEPKDNIFFFSIKSGETLCSFAELKKIKDNTYACVVSYNDLMTDSTKEYKAFITVTNGNESVYSNDIPVKFYREQIKGLIVKANTSEILAIKKELASINKTIELVFSGRIPKAIPEFSLENCKKGMIPTVISDDGVVALTYPFSDILNEVNGKKSVMRSIVLDAKDLKLNEEETNLDALVKAMRENQRKESEILKNILSQISTLTTKVAGLEATLVDFRNNQ